ncbi:hybrid signal transduction histidine kinase M [Tanacetum coccineum]
MTPLTPEELKVDKIVLSWILFTLSDSLRARIVVARPKSAKEAWSLLSEIVKDNKRSRTNSLKAELRSIKLGDQSMESYFQRIGSIVTIITSLGAHVNDEDIVHYAIDGLPDTYNQVCGYMHWKDTFPDLKSVRSLLVTEEMRLMSRATSLPVDASSPLVLVAESGGNRRSSSTPQGKSWKPCFNFAKGTCRFGDSCRYVHDPNAMVNNANKGSGTRTPSTHDMLQQLLAKLGNLGVTCSVPNTTVPTVAPVAYHTSPSPLPGPTVTPPPGFTQPAQYYYSPNSGPVSTTMAQPHS